MFVISYSVCPGRPFKVSLMLVVKQEVYPRVENLKGVCFTRVGSVLSHKDQTKLERLARNKHYGLVRIFAIYGQKVL